MKLSEKHWDGILCWGIATAVVMMIVWAGFAMRKYERAKENVAISNIVHSIIPMYPTYDSAILILSNIVIYDARKTSFESIIQKIVAEGIESDKRKAGVTVITNVVKKGYERWIAPERVKELGGKE